MQQKTSNLRELFPSSMQEVDEIMWTGRSQLEMLCSLKELSESHVVLQVSGKIPEVGTRGILWLPYFEIFPAVICARTDTTFTAKFEELDAVRKKHLDYFLSSRKTGAKRKRPNIIARSILKAAYLIEQSLQDIERRTFPSEEFPWSLDFEKHSDLIRKEVDNMFNNISFESIPEFHDINPKTRAVLIAQQGKVEENTKQLFPTIARLVANVPSLANAELSMLAPGAELRIHKASWRCFLRMHIGIIVPKGDICLELEGERLEWENGKVMIFDDFYSHTAWNKAEETRVILMVDFFRPMHKWQKFFFRFAQRVLVAPRFKIPDEWLSWIDKK